MPQVIQSTMSRSTSFIKLLISIVFLGGTIQAIAQPFTRQDTLRGSITPEREWWDLNYYDLAIDFDIANKKIHFKTLDHSKVKTVLFSAFDFSCSGVSKAIDMNLDIQGEISNSFEQFSLDLNRRMVEKAFQESRSQIKASEEALKATWQYPEHINCTQKSPGNYP